ncbi:MAG: DUF2269 family protein [Solirubrobacterales bacterium]
MEISFGLINAYNVSLWIHITAAVVGLGATFAESILMSVTMKSEPRHMPLVFRIQLTINRYFAQPALLLIIATGIYQVAGYDYWDFGSFWISASFMIVLILGGLTGGYFIPTDKKLLKVSERDIKASGDGPVEFSEEFTRLSRGEALFGPVSGFLVVAAIFLMVVKPGA